MVDRDISSIAKINDQNGKADGGFGGRDRQDEEREDLPRQIVLEDGKRHKVDVDGQQHQLDRHQDDDNVPAIEEYPHHADRKQESGDDEKMRQTYSH